MLRHKWYRWIRALFGARSFVKIGKDGQTTHVLIRSSWNIAPLIESLEEQGFKEEWPRYEEYIH